MVSKLEKFVKSRKTHAFVAVALISAIIAIIVLSANINNLPSKDETDKLDAKYKALYDDSTDNVELVTELTEQLAAKTQALQNAIASNLNKVAEAKQQTSVLLAEERAAHNKTLATLKTASSRYGASINYHNRQISKANSLCAANIAKIKKSLAETKSNCATSMASLRIELDKY